MKKTMGTRWLLSRWPSAATETLLASANPKNAEVAVGGTRSVGRATWIATSDAFYVRHRYSLIRDDFARFAWKDVVASLSRPYGPGTHAVSFIGQGWSASAEFVALGWETKWFAIWADMLTPRVATDVRQSYSRYLAEEWEFAQHGDERKAAHVVSRVFEAEPWIADQIQVYVRIVGGFTPNEAPHPPALNSAISWAGYPALREKVSGS